MKINPWTFGGLFLLVSSIWMYHNFELPTFYPFEKTGTVKAVAFQTKLVDPLLPDYYGEYDQIVHFVYQIGDLVYISKHRAHRLGQFQKIGDSLLIRYSINDPQRTDPIRYYHNVSNKSGDDHIKKSFLHTKANGHKALDLHVNIFTYEDYGSYGKLLAKTTGIYREKDSVLTLTPLIYYQNRKVADTVMEQPKPINEDFEKIYLSNFKQNPNGSITEMNTNLLFNLTGQK